MRFALRQLRLSSPRSVEAEFFDISTGLTGIAVRVGGPTPDIFQWCYGSAEDVRTVTRAVHAFVEAARLASD